MTVEAGCLPSDERLHRSSRLPRRLGVLGGYPTYPAVGYHYPRAFNFPMPNT